MSIPIKEISSRLYELEERPEFEIPPFPWQELEQIFSQRFPGKTVTLKHENKGWFEGEPWISSFKERDIFPIFVQPVENPLFFALAKEDLKAVLTHLIDVPEANFYFLEDAIYQSFSYFFAAEILKLVSALKFSEYLAYHVVEDKDLGLKTIRNEPFFIINVTLTIDQVSSFGSLIIPESFRAGWKKHFLQQYGPQFSLPLQKKLDLDFSIEIGHVDLMMGELKGLSRGDWILLDHCSYHPDKKEGFAVLTMGNQPLFRARLKKDELKVLEYPHLHKGEAMDKDELFEEFNLEEPLEDEEDFYEEESEEEQEEEKIASQHEADASLLSKIPLRLVVEISRLKMSLEELGKLQAGSVFELPTSYEEGVRLVANGKVIGRGELVKIGEKMGVRITEL